MKHPINPPMKPSMQARRPLSVLPIRASKVAGRAAGFTLVEAIIVITITAILAGMVAIFIRLPFLTYIDVAARADLTDQADTALRRVARDVRLALPNSVRVKTIADPAGDKHYLELLLTKTGGRYLHEEDALAGNVLQFERPGLDCALTPADAACSFTVVGAMPVAPLDIGVGDKIVVYNLGLDAADAYSGGNLANVRAVNGNLISLSNNPFALQNPALSSPSHRFQVVTTPVTYFCDAKADGSGRLLRYAGYAITPSQPTPPAGVGLQTALLADGVKECSFNYGNTANTHSGLLGITIKMTRLNKDTGDVQLFSQVHVDNTP